MTDASSTDHAHDDAGTRAWHRDLPDAATPDHTHDGHDHAAEP